jgi:hypothetical protein
MGQRNVITAVELGQDGGINLGGFFRGAFPHQEAVAEINNTATVAQGCTVGNLEEGGLTLCPRPGRKAKALLSEIVD